MMTGGGAGLLATRLAQATGIDMRSLEAGRLRWIVEGRCRELGLGSAGEYEARVQESVEELDRLIDEVVVQETRFFRDPAVFEHLASWVPVMAEMFPGPLRVLSAPCGTGQEAWSVAATMRRMGVATEKFAVDAFDLSLGALEVARRGLYPGAALDHAAPELQRNCGRREGGEWKIDDELRDRVRFERRNLAEPGVLGEAPVYHLILCRNLFIYLAPQARKALAESLATALVPGGRLILGTADRVEELHGLFAPVRPAATFAFVRRGTAQARPAAARVPAEVALPLAASPAKVQVRPAAERTPQTAEDLFLRAVHHREHGNLRHAERRCRQALYVDPAFLPAMELLEALWGRQPNLRLRRALRARIVRTRTAAGIGEARSPEGTEVA